MALRPGYAPAPPGMEQTFPFGVGPRYQQYGEQPGYIYNPYTDQYQANPVTADQIQAGQGGKPKEKGTDYGQVAAVAGVTAGVPAAFKYGGKYLTQQGGKIFTSDTPTGNPTPQTGGAPTGSSSGATGGLVGAGTPESGGTSVSGAPTSGGETGAYAVKVDFADGTSKVVSSGAEADALANNPDVVGAEVVPSTGTEAGATGGSFDNFSYGDALQIAGTIYSGYQSYKAFEEGDNVKGGIYAAGTAAGLAGYAAWPFAVAATMWGSYKGAKDAKKAVGGDLTKDEFEASTDPSYHRKKEELWSDIGLPKSPGGLLNDAIGYALGYKSRKSDRTILRERVRHGLMKIEDELGRGGFRRGENDAFEMQLADGSYYNIGKDGGEKSLGYDGKTEITKGGEVDTSHPLSGFATGLVAPVMATIFQGNKKGEETGFEAHFINGIISNANGDDPQTVIENARKLYYSMGLDSKESMYQFIENLGQNEKNPLSQEEIAAYENAVNIIFDDVNGEAYNGDLPTKPQENTYGVQQGVVQGQTAPVQNAPDSPTGGLVGAGGENLQINASPGPVDPNNPQGISAPVQQQAAQGTGQQNLPQNMNSQGGLVQAGKPEELNPVTKFAFNR